jgi:LPXTG-site transpeptidase (sortase) family protein
MRRKKRRGLVSRLTTPLRRLNRIQWLIVVVMLVAAGGGSAALVVILNGPSDSQPNIASVPITLPSGGVPPSSGKNVLETTKIVIPAAGINIRAIQGNGVTVPLNLAMHYPTTAWPGQGSNSLFYAHAQPGMFQGLYSLHKGDLIDVFRSDGSELTYRVTAFEKVPYNDTAVLAPSHFEELSLLTCTSYNAYTDRFVVLAVPSGTVTSS